MDTIEINRWATSNENLRENFAGTFACDKLPREKLDELTLPQYFVINSCKASLNSVNFCHWTSLAVFSKRIFYFDSSGLPTHLSNVHIREFIQLQNKIVHSSRKQIQGFSSSLCGLFCLTFMACIALKISFKSFLSFFRNNHNLDKNDGVVRKLFKQTFIKK